MRVYAQHSAADHHEIGDLFKEVAETDMSSSAWLANFTKLKTQYLDHLKEEEETIFPRALKDIGEPRAVELKDEFNAQKPEEIDRAEAGTDEKLNEQIG